MGVPTFMSVPTFATTEDALRDIDPALDRVDSRGGALPGASAFRIEAVSTSGTKRAPHRNGFFAVVLLEEGRGLYSLDGVEEEAGPQTAYVARPGHVKAYAYSEPPSGWVVTFTEAFLKAHARADVFQAVPFLVTEPALSAPVDARTFRALSTLAAQVAAELGRPSSVQAPLVAAHLVALLLRLREALWDGRAAAETSALDPAAADRDAAIAQSFRADLEARLRALVAGEASAAPSVAELAEAQGLHPDHLSAAVRRVTGRPAGGWAADALAAEARGLLVDPGASVKEVAYRLGFSEPTAFSRFFKRETGVSPTTFRRRVVRSPSRAGGSEASGSEGTARGAGGGVGTGSESVGSGHVPRRHASVGHPILNPPRTPMPSLVLVTGATGHQGGAVARHLLGRGVAVRALTRDPDSDAARALARLGAEVAEGDFDDAPSLDRALDGADAAFSLQLTTYADGGRYTARELGRELRQGMAFADAAQRAGLRHLVYSSVGGAERRSGVPTWEPKRAVEAYLHETGLPLTVLRPVGLMENHRWSADAIRSGRLAGPLRPDSVYQQVATDDVGLAAAEAFTDPDGWLGRAVELAGDAPTMAETAAAFADALGRPVEYVRVPWEAFEERAGPALTSMWRWIEADGFQADVEALRRELPGLTTIGEFARREPWVRSAVGTGGSGAARAQREAAVEGPEGGDDQ